jgi:cation diffusion facilitator family transporter
MSLIKEKKQRVREASHVTAVGFAANIYLTAFKISAGITGKSSAMVADGIHSLSDLATDIVVFISVRIAGRDKDKNHRYGHGKFETFGTMIVSLALALVGAGVLVSGMQKILSALSGEIIPPPSMIALSAALLSILTKEALFWYTVKCGKKIDSQAVIANAWHHRSDALSSIATTIGISGAMFLGERWTVLDPIAGVLVSILILKIAFDLIVPCIKELLENALPEDTENDIMNAISGVEGVRAFHNLKTRKIGSAVAIEVHVKVDKMLSVEQSHNIATQIEIALRDRYGSDTHTGIHIEPYYG